MKTRLIALAFFIFSSVILKAHTCDSLEVIKRGFNYFVLHKVEKGETLYALSKRYNTSVNKIVGANDGKKGLKVGQLVYIPYEQKPITHIVTAGETLYSISRKHQMSVEDIKKINNLTSNSLSIGQELTIKKSPIPLKPSKVEQKPVVTKSKAKVITHFVEKKEGLYSISKRYDVPIDSIKSWNKLSSNDIKNGQKLIIYRQEKVTIDQKTGRDENAAIHNFEKIVEEGSIALSNNPKLQSEFSFCLHKTAKKGQIIRVISDEGKEAYVKVIGSISEEDPNILHLNQTAFDRFNTNASKFTGKAYYIAE